MRKSTQKPDTVLGKIFYLLRGINIHPGWLAVPLTLSLGAAAFEGVGLGLLIPMLQGFLERDYSFITQIPGLETALSYLPASISLSDRALFLTLISFFVGAIFVKNILRFLAAVSMGYFTSRALHHLRKVLFGRFLSFGKLYFDRTSVGYNSTVLTQFTEAVLLPVRSINLFVNAIFSLCVYVVIMFMISWQLTAFTLPLFLVLHFSVRIAIRKISAFSRAIADRGTVLGKASVETLSTMPLVKAYSSETLEQDKYAGISDEHARLDFRSTRLKELVAPLQEMVTLACVIILFAGMMYLLIRRGEGAPTSFIVYFYLILNASTKFGVLTHFRGTLAYASGPVEEVMRAFDDEDKAFIPDGTVTFPGLKKDIEFRNLSFGYPGKDNVLQNISSTIPKGNLIAVVGPTGSGKSTLIHLIMRLYDPKPGTLFIDGTDIREFSLASLHDHIALVSQETLLLHDTLRANITYGLDDVSDKRLKEVLTQARLNEVVDGMPQGLNTLIGDRGVKLSGGEKQRVSIARALLKGAEILILDEATSALDSRTEKLIQEAIDEAVRGRTAVVIAHRLSTIQNADKIMVIENGKLAEEGKLDELLKKKGLFASLWEEQKFV